MDRVEQKQPCVVNQILRFYIDGFRRMTLGKTLWKVIIIKLIIIFGVLKLFFFHDFLGTKFHTDEQRADYVLSELIRSAQAHSCSVEGER